MTGRGPNFGAEVFEEPEVGATSFAAHHAIIPPQTDRQRSFRSESSKVRACKQSSLFRSGPNKKSSKCLINSLGRYKNIMRKTICLQKKKKKGKERKKKVRGGDWQGPAGCSARRVSVCAGAGGREGARNGPLTGPYCTSVRLSNFELGRKGAARKFA